MRFLTALAAGLAASGCAVGPDFKQPPPPTVKSYLTEPLPEQTESTSVVGGDTQRFVTGMAIPAQWWTLFKSPELDALIEVSFKAGPQWIRASVQN